MTKKTELTPTRRALEEALVTQQQYHAEIARIATERQRLEGLIAAEAEAQATLARIETAERAEILAWVQAGEQGEEPQPHASERRAADRMLRIAGAQAEHARKQLVELDAQHAAVNAKVNPIAREVNYRVQQVLLETSEELAEPYRQAVADATKYLSALLALRRRMGEACNAEDSRTAQHFEPTNKILGSAVDQGALLQASELLWGTPGFTSARERGTQAAADFWNALTSNPAAPFTP